MKKLIALLLSAVMCLSLAACGGTGNNNKSETEQTGDITDSSTESTEPIVTKEDMDGFWITSNGYYIIFDGDNIYSIESVEGYTDIESSAGFYLKDASGNERIGVDVDYGYSIEGNQLSFNTSLGEETFVYEILKNDDTLSLKFIEREREGACPNSKLPAVMIADLTKAYDLNKQPLLDASELEALLPQTGE
jgi:predicted small lipoprotein YifL